MDGRRELCVHVLLPSGFFASCVSDSCFLINVSVSNTTCDSPILPTHGFVCRWRADGASGWAAARRSHEPLAPLCLPANYFFKVGTLLVDVFLISRVGKHMPKLSNNAIEIKAKMKALRR